jgi:8-oxo-dGTP pyrophosphatase MutT (NUDIX family)
LTNKVEKAGIIPFYMEDDGLTMMFMKPSDKNYGGKKFQIAKGHIDPGENPLEAAVRECYEELGLLENNIIWLEKCGIFLTNHHIFIAQVKDNSPKAFTDYTDETEDTAWLGLDEFLSVGRGKHGDIVERCVAHFNYSVKKRG